MKIGYIYQANHAICIHNAFNAAQTVLIPFAEIIEPDNYLLIFHFVSLSAMSGRVEHDGGSYGGLEDNFQLIPPADLPVEHCLCPIRDVYLLPKA